jgi:hypothetical protein
MRQTPFSFPRFLESLLLPVLFWLLCTHASNKGGGVAYGVRDDLYNAVIVADVKSVDKLLASRDVFVAGRFPVIPDRVSVSNLLVAKVYVIVSAFYAIAMTINEWTVATLCSSDWI